MISVDILQRLIQYEEESVQEIQGSMDMLRETLKVPMMDVDIVAKLVLVAHYGREVYVSGVMESEDHRITNRLAYLRQRERMLTPQRKSRGKITDRDIERAREVPIPSLMKFVRLQAKCLWHTDRNPSLHYYMKGNRVHCFVCARNEDAIGVYMALNNCDFKTAVRGLI